MRRTSSCCTSPTPPTPSGRPTPSATHGRARTTAVRLGVIPVGGGATVWVDWDRTSFPYLAQVTWQPNAPLTIVVVQNREQTAEQVYAVDAATGKPTALLTETDAAWLNLDPAMPRWLPDGQTFLWTSERGGAGAEAAGRDGQLLCAP